MIIVIIDCLQGSLHPVCHSSPSKFALQLTSKLLREQRQQLDIFSRYIFPLGLRQKVALSKQSFTFGIFWSFGFVKFVDGFLEWTSDIVWLALRIFVQCIGTFWDFLRLGGSREHAQTYFLDASWQGNGDSILSKVTSKLPELSSSILGHAWSNLQQLQNKIMPLFLHINLHMGMRAMRQKPWVPWWALEWPSDFWRKIGFDPFPYVACSAYPSCINDTVFAQMGLAPSLPECVSAAFCTSEMWGSLF